MNSCGEPGYSRPGVRNDELSNRALLTMFNDNGRRTIGDRRRNEVMTVRGEASHCDEQHTRTGLAAVMGDVADRNSIVADYLASHELG